MIIDLDMAAIDQAPRAEALILSSELLKACSAAIGGEVSYVAMDGEPVAAIVPIALVGEALSAEILTLRSN